MNAPVKATLANRLGTTTHQSPLRFKLVGLMREFPALRASALEDWLIDVANARGARVVFREENPEAVFERQSPPLNRLSNEELVAALCQPQCIDRPPLLRLAGQLISRHAVVASVLLLVAERERVGFILAELARQALRIAPDHALWRQLAAALANVRRPRDVLLHWTRLAEPVMRNGRCNAESWRLVA